jgi:hypothetical protein
MASQPRLQVTSLAPCSPSSQRPSDVSRYVGQLVFHIGKSVPNWDDEIKIQNATGTGGSHPDPRRDETGM